MFERSRAGRLGITVLAVSLVMFRSGAVDPASHAAPPTFADNTVLRSADYDHYTTLVGSTPQSWMSGGIAAGDYDNDGWTDLYVTRLDAPDILFRNNMGTFVDVSATAFAGTTTITKSNGAAWGDIDKRRRSRSLRHGAGGGALFPVCQQW